MSIEEHSKEVLSQDHAQEPPQQLYGGSLFDSALRGSRKLLLSTLVLPIIYTSLLMWVCLSLYWGSTTYTSLQKLSVYAINLDDGYFGQKMITNIRAAANQDPTGLDWHFESAVKSATMTQDLVLDEKAWAAIQSMCFQPSKDLKDTDSVQSIHRPHHLLKQVYLPMHPRTIHYMQSQSTSRQRATRSRRIRRSFPLFSRL